MTGEMRNPTTFMRLVPGVVGRGSTSMSNPEAIFNTAVNGGQTLSLEIQLDGAAILGSNLPGDLRIIGFPVDAVQEFKLSTNNFAAELGRTGGGVTSFTLKSGTNQIHGSVYEFFRNEVLNANGFFNNLGAIVPALEKRHELSTSRMNTDLHWVVRSSRIEPLPLDTSMAFVIEKRAPGESFPFQPQRSRMEISPAWNPDLRSCNDSIQRKRWIHS